ncbi:MAG: site-2 protease family protein [Clostridia bacterium]|nr:site-2 protease family protein [Clostridia bacterium]
MFGYNFDKRSLFILMGVMILLTFVSLGTNNIIISILTLPGVIIAISFHEFAHAFAADRLGDRTPRNQGRLTINPSAHLDPVGMVVLLFAKIGWGKPVQINPNNFTTKSKEKGEAIVAIAGPLMNFLLAIVFTIIFYILSIVDGSAVFEMMTSTQIPGMSFMALITLVVYYAIIVNIGLGVFNLIPIPPLDGSKIFLRLLPYKAQRWIDQNETMIYMIFLLLCFTRILGIITGPVIMFIGNGIFWLIGTLFSLFI